MTENEATVPGSPMAYNTLIGRVSDPLVPLFAVITFRGASGVRWRLYTISHYGSPMDLTGYLRELGADAYKDGSIGPSKTSHLPHTIRAILSDLLKVDVTREIEVMVPDGRDE